MGARFNPSPVVTVGEWPVNEPTTFLGRKAFLANARTLTGGLKITWGRKDIWTQPEPAVLTFTVFDSTGYWARKIADKNALNTGVTVHFDLPKGTNYPDAPGDIYTIFRGWTAKATATRHRAWTTNGWEYGFLVTITCTDRSGAVGQTPYVNITLPAQNMLDRFIRLRNDSAAVGIREYYFDTSYTAAPIKEFKYDDASGLDVFGDMYRSMGDTWAYNPNRNTVNRIPSHGDTSAFAVLTDKGDGELIPLPGPKADPSGQETVHDKAYYATGFIDGSEVASKTVLEADQSGEIGQIVGKWNNGLDNMRPINTTLTLSAARPPYRTLTFDSHLTDGRNLDPTMYKQQFKVQTFSGPNHPSVRYETGRYGGFITLDQAMFWLMPCERHTLAFVGASPWTEATANIGPYVSPCGGTIEYAGGNWTIDADLLRGHSMLPGTTDAVPNPYGLTWNAPKAELTWNAPGKKRLTRGFSWNDARYMITWETR